MMMRPQSGHVDAGPNAGQAKTPERHPADTLGLEPAEMRRLGHLVVDLVVEHFQNRATIPVVRTGERADLLGALGGPVPTDPGNPDEAISTLVEIAMAHMQHGDHPRFFARIPGPSSFAAVLGEWLSSGHNAIASSWATASGPTTVELVVIEWLREILGMPEGTEGVLLSGGALANLTAFGAARTVRGDGVAYLTDQTHAALSRDLLALGFPRHHVRILPSDDEFRLSMPALRSAVAQDKTAGRHPLMVIATAGTTNTGTVDPLPAIADFCAEMDLWFHVDGAYGAPAALCETGRATLAGIERADSLVLDPHKWLFQPYGVGCLLVRHPGVLKRTFSFSAEYVKDVQATHDEVDFRDRSLELTRRSRALQLWLTFRVYGVDRIRAAVTRGIRLAEFAEEVLRNDTMWDVVTPAQLGIVTFALRGADERQHVTRAAEVVVGGYAAVTPTMLQGRSVLRLCTINPTTTQDDIVGTLDQLKGLQ